MSWVRRLALAALVVALSACDDGSEVTIDEGEVLPYEQIGFGQRAQSHEPIEELARDESEWNALAKRVRPLEPFKTVNFSQEMVALIAVPTESGGYAIEVDQAEVVRDTVVISYVVYTPGSDCISTMGLAQPFQAVSLKQAPGIVRFERRNERYSCDM
ncbi:MAG: hypothetical protein COV99_03590 [Bacteroidetes bacterium CG12_big_fil_rev_8_21_14_0_65_60_17]|nr:MAG: hypothetical protein COV99_03590 [Bacteroidetes bacterium CG12_big_fil_rev_8_21_14_0_65_60_17]